MVEDQGITAEEVTEQVVDAKFESAGDDSVVKVDLSKPLTNETEEAEAEPAGMVGGNENPETSEEQEEVQPQGEEQEVSTLEEITDEVVDEAEEVVVETPDIVNALPENIQKLVDFMEDTGGDLGDYVKLNADTSKLDNSEVLDQFYKATKPHLSAEERNFLLEDRFGFDEDMDEERTVRGKKIAMKEQVAEARAYIDGQKSKYYEEIKAGSKLTNEQQKAVNFFDRYNKESEEADKHAKSQKEFFKQKTETVFNDNFKGFEYNVGDKRFRFNVKNVNDVKADQGDIGNFVQKFLDKDNKMSDAKGYHKSLFTANNPDAIAQHFYEQGKADAIKETIAKSKNIDVNSRGTHGETNVGGLKVRVLGEGSDDFKFKIRKKK